MRTLLLLRGAPGVGKSTWIQENGLKDYTLSADDIRLLCQSPVLSPNGAYEISIKNDKTTWSILFTLLETRMSHGEFTVIDATNSKTSEMQQYKKLAKKYRYRIFCADFTDIPIEVVKERNANRDVYKRIPKEEIDKMYARFKTQKIPSGIKIIKPNELDQIWYRKSNFDDYRRIYTIGDIHGCFSVLIEALKHLYTADNFLDIMDKISKNEDDDNKYKLLSELIEDDILYIFCGDYIDRGIENAEVVKFLLEIYNKPNIILLEGNHEIWLRKWSHDEECTFLEFNLNTRKQLEDQNISKKKVRQLCNKFAQCSYFDYKNKTYIITHGGLSNIPKNLIFISTEQLIEGVGKYDDYLEVYKSFEQNIEDNVYQIHGHRNTKQIGIYSAEYNRNYNLEGRVEFGGELRVAKIIDNISGYYFKNEVFREPEKKEETLDLSSVEDVVKSMRENEFITEKQFGNISSFNFNPKAFYNKIWNEQTVKARGLFIDTDNMKVFARSYDKFFNINEVERTKFANLYNMSFPVTAYVKENGFLGVVSYNEYTDDLFITSKSDPFGEFADLLREDFYKIVPEDKVILIKEYLKNHDVSFVFENCDSKNDPHMIKYEENKLFLLDIIYNTLEYKKYNYNKLCAIAKELELEVKEKAYTIYTWQEFYDWYYEITKDNWKYNGRYIEGFVIEDSEGFMTKIKLQYYNFWKFMRNNVVENVVKRGYIEDTGALKGDIDNLFYGWVREYREKFIEKYGSLRYFPKRNIIKLREKFYKETELEEK